MKERCDQGNGSQAGKAVEKAALTMEVLTWIQDLETAAENCIAGEVDRKMSLSELFINAYVPLERLQKLQDVLLRRPRVEAAEERPAKDAAPAEVEQLRKGIKELGDTLRVVYDYLGTLDFDFRTYVSDTEWSGIQARLSTSRSRIKAVLDAHFPKRKEAACACCRSFVEMVVEQDVAPRVCNSCKEKVAAAIRCEGFRTGVTQ